MKQPAKHLFLLLIALIAFQHSQAQLVFEAKPHIPENSLKLKGIKIIFKIDTVQTLGKDSGIKFSLKIENNRDTTIWIKPPVYDPILYMGVTLKNKAGQQLYQNGLSRWGYSNTNGMRPFTLPFVVDSAWYLGRKMPKRMFKHFIMRMDHIPLFPNDSVEYFLDLREAHLALVARPDKIRIPRGLYSFDINLWLKIIGTNYHISFKEIHTKVRLE